jgi:hypothetical protein
LIGTRRHIRIRALPARARPFWRRRAPLSSGEPVIPPTAMRAIVRRPCPASAAAGAAEPRIRRELLQRVALDTRHERAGQPARLAHLDHGDQSAILVQSSGRSAQVIRLRHGALRRLGLQRRLCRRSPLAPYYLDPDIRVLAADAGDVGIQSGRGSSFAAPLSHITRHTGYIRSDSSDAMLLPDSPWEHSCASLTLLRHHMDKDTTTHSRSRTACR